MHKVRQRQRQRKREKGRQTDRQGISLYLTIKYIYEPRDS